MEITHTTTSTSNTSNGSLLPCPLCLVPIFGGVETLRSSLIRAATTQLECPICGEHFLGLDKLTIHLFTHVGHADEVKNNTNNNENNNKNEGVDCEESSVPEIVRCEICNFTFADSTILEMHQKLLHESNKIADEPSISTVESGHAIENNAVFKCHLCSKQFKKRGSLMVHLRVAHYGFTHNNSDFYNFTLDVNNSNDTNGCNNNNIHNNKQWECDVCAKTFTTKYFLKKHKRLHTGEMPYTCTQCNKSFTFQQSYHKHILYHSSEKPHVCTECGRAFKELSTLQNHQRIHSGERPFVCETCGKRFRQRVSYLVHQRIHTGVLPYKCTACDKRFRYKVCQRSHKCPVDPPGTVVRIVSGEEVTGEEVANTHLVEKKEINNGVCDTEMNHNKCVMSVDFETGSINLVPVEERDSKPCEDMPLFNDTQPDLFSMVMSPLLPEVENLCLAGSPEDQQKHLDFFL